MFGRRIIPPRRCAGHGRRVRLARCRLLAPARVLRYGSMVATVAASVFRASTWPISSTCIQGPVSRVLERAGPAATWPSAGHGLNVSTHPDVADCWGSNRGSNGTEPLGMRIAKGLLRARTGRASGYVPRWVRFSGSCPRPLAVRVLAARTPCTAHVSVRRMEPTYVRGAGGNRTPVQQSENGPDTTIPALRLRRCTGGSATHPKVDHESSFRIVSGLSRRQQSFLPSSLTSVAGL